MHDLGTRSPPTLGNVRAGMGCAWCAGIQTDADEVVAVMRGLGAEPLEPYRSANLPWRCRCNKCGNEITPTYANARKFSPCRYCAPFGFSYNDPAVVYLLRHGRYQALKIGVASEASKYDRIADHGRHGWKMEQRHNIRDLDADVTPSVGAVRRELAAGDVRPQRRVTDVGPLRHGVQVDVVLQLVDASLLRCITAPTCRRRHRRRNRHRPNG